MTNKFQKPPPMWSKRPYSMPVKNEWPLIVSFLLNLHVDGIRKHICISCGFAHLYDISNKQYKVHRMMSLETVKQIVEEIKQTNDKILDTSGNAAKS